ncbi:MAG: rod shape-determining protein MreC [Clostridia bacterium]|nr:rod shape-determining protein MreC [Clostridia bacterium]
MAKKHQSEKSRKRSIRIRRALYSLLVTVAVFVILYYLVLRPAGSTSIVENGIGTVFTPIQRAAKSVTEFVKSWFGVSDDENDLEAMLEELQMENDMLRIQLDTYADMESENNRLEMLLGAKESYESLSPIYAKVIAKDMGVWFNSFTINRGQSDGLSTNMAVVNADGLIGRIYEIGYNYAKVISIIDPRSYVATLIGRTRDNGMMQGETTASSDEAECNMYYLPNIGNVKVGDEVFTSGLDSLFPKGIRVGTISAISRDADTADKYAVVNPSVNFASIEEVYVLKEVVGYDYLPALPTETPRPIVTPKPTAVSDIYTYETPKAIDDNAAWSYPTVTPSATQPAFENMGPISTAKPPEAIWIDM